MCPDVLAGARGKSTGSNVPLPGVFYQWILGRRPHVRVEFGEPIVIAEPSSGGDSPEVATDRLMRRIAAMLPESHRGAYGAASEGTIVVLREVRERPPRPSPVASDDDAPPQG